MGVALSRSPPFQLIIMKPLKQAPLNKPLWTTSDSLENTLDRRLATISSRTQQEIAGGTTKRQVWPAI